MKGTPSRHRYPMTIIGQAIWQYHRFNHSYRDVREQLLYRGIEVSHETIRSWCYKFGKDFEKVIKKKQRKVTDKWHLDEQCIMINGRKYWLWRAIDQHGYELDVLVQSKRNTKAALRFFRKLLKGLQYVPRVIITDKLKSYGSAKKKILKEVEHRSHKGLNNRIEVAHEPTRLREKQMRKFKSPPHAQRFLSAFGVVRNYFKVGLYKLTAKERKEKIKDAFNMWAAISLLEIVS